MPRTPLEHTADTGLEATARSLEAVITELAAGMFELMASVDPCLKENEVVADVTAPSHEDLIVDSLSELLYLAETEDLHFCHFQVREKGELTLEIRAAGVPNSEVEPTGPSIKAVTYHQLEISEREDGWYARVYFDV